MFDLSLPAASLGTAYPEQVRPRPGKLDRVATWLSGPLVRQARVWRAQRTHLLEAINHHGESLAKLPDPGLRHAATELRVTLRREGFSEDAVARTFALVREAATRTIGLEASADFRIDPKERHLELTNAGRARLDEWGPSLPPLFHGERRREELVSQALVALQLFHRDTHYLVRDKKVQIIDEFTGRVLADRTWEQGLHQMVEAKEELPLSSRQTSVARITYQRFFRRYLWLAGMTGTAHEVRRELWSVYCLPVVRVPTHRPVLRRSTGDRVFTTEAEKWAAIVARVKTLHDIGRPVLIGTRSVSASEKLSAHLTEAGQYGRITVATNMAGRALISSWGPASPSWAVCTSSPPNCTSRRASTVSSSAAAVAKVTPARWRR